MFISQVLKTHHFWPMPFQWNLMWRVHPPKQIETIVAYGDLIHQIAKISTVVCHHLLRSDCHRTPILWTKQCWDLKIISIVPSMTLILGQNHHVAGWIPFFASETHMFSGHSRTFQDRLLEPHPSSPQDRLHFKATHRQVLALWQGNGEAVAERGTGFGAS